VIASFAALGDVAIAEPGALMSFAGPRVVQQTTRETLPDDFGLASANLELGHVDAVVPRPELRDALGRLLGVLGGHGPEPEVEEVVSTNGGGGRLGRLRIRHLLRRGDHDGQG
jgi:acetyl-CoA carboxylase carboxyl transferase subunit beta